MILGKEQKQEQVVDTQEVMVGQGEQEPFMLENFEYHDEKLFGTHAEQKSNLNNVYTIAKELGFHNGFISALLGNGQKEAPSYSGSAKQLQGGPGIGIMQFDWHKPYYKEFLESTGKDDGVRSQLEYLKNLMFDNSSFFKEVRSKYGPGHAAKLRSYYENPEIDVGFLSDELLDRFYKPRPSIREETRQYRKDASLHYYNQLQGL